MKLRIGIDGRDLMNKETGIGRYVRELCLRLDSLMPEAEFFVYSRFQLNVPPISTSWHYRIDPHPPRWLTGYAWLKWCSQRFIKPDELDVFWGSRTLLPPLDPSVGSVVTVYDLNHLIAPDTMVVVNRLAHALWLRRDVLHSDVVLPISTGTKERIFEHFGRVSDGIVLPGTDARYHSIVNPKTAEVLSRYQLSPPYILTVGALEPRKNIATLVDAFLTLRAQGKLAGYTLALAGTQGWKQKGLRHRLAKGMPDIKVLGYVPEDDLPALYTAAELFVMPSLYEGYGMPVAEARACGTRVVASDLPELHEAGDLYTHYVKPNQAGLMTGILSALSEPRPCANPGSSWDASAKVLADAFCEAAKIAKRRDCRPSST